MSDIDVSQLSTESLTEGSFPASRSADFRVHFGDDVHEAIASHAAEDTSIEICGVLVGEWRKDEDGPFAVIRNFIRCDNAASKNAEVTFTHESWAQINEEMDSKYSDQRIIGWYHSHPDFGIFLSDRDMFIQEHFFNGPGQIAYVVDPVRKLEGVFEWRSGKAAVMDCYWVGDRIVTSAASESTNQSRTSMTSAGIPAVTAGFDAQVGTEPVSLAGAALPSTTVMLAWACVFLLGYLLDDLKSNWERQYVSDGVVAHYGLWNILQVGRAELVEDSRKRVDLAFDSVSELSSDHARLLEGDEQKKVRESWQQVRKQLVKARDTLKSVEDRYSVPKEQRDLLAKVVVERLLSLNRMDMKRETLPVPMPVGFPELVESVLKAQGQAVGPGPNAGSDPESSESSAVPARNGSPKPLLEGAATGKKPGTRTTPIGPSGPPDASAATR